MGTGVVVVVGTACALAWADAKTARRSAESIAAGMDVSVGMRMRERR
jgi:hypothetical protein